MTETSNNKYCLACGSEDYEEWATATDLEYYTTDELFHYNKCHICGSLFIDPVPIDKLNIIYPKNYYSYSESHKSFIFKIKEIIDRRVFKKLLRKIKKTKINVLDVGGGTGWLLDLIKELDMRVDVTQVVDIDSNAEEQAKRNGHEYFCGTIEEFNTPYKFDLVLLLNLIEHVYNPTELLSKISESVNPDGIILIKTPNIESLDASIFRNANWAGYHCPRHWILFSKKSFEKLVIKTDLKIIDFKYTQGAPFWAWSIIFKLQHLKLIKLNREKPVIYHWLFPILSGIFATFDYIRMPVFKTSQMFILLKK